MGCSAVWGFPPCCTFPGTTLHVGTPVWDISPNPPSPWKSLSALTWPKQWAVPCVQEGRVGVLLKRFSSGCLNSIFSQGGGLPGKWKLSPPTWAGCGLETRGVFCNIGWEPNFRTAARPGSDICLGPVPAPVSCQRLALPFLEWTISYLFIYRHPCNEAEEFQQLLCFANPLLNHTQTKKLPGP